MLCFSGKKYRDSSFSEEKEAKRLFSRSLGAASLLGVGSAVGTAQQIKVFWFFFFKKRTNLAY
jgi:hypothetical protein